MKLEISQTESESVSLSEIGFAGKPQLKPIPDSDRFGKVVISGNSH